MKMRPKAGVEAADALKAAFQGYIQNFFVALFQKSDGSFQSVHAQKIRKRRFEDCVKIS